MAKESDSYRDILASLKEHFGDEEILTVTQVSRYLHMDYRTLLNNKTFKFLKIGKRYVIHINKLARQLAA